MPHQDAITARRFEMEQKEIKLIDGPMDGGSTFVFEHTNRFFYSTGDVYVRNKDGCFHWSRQESEMEKRRLNEFLANKKARKR